MSIEEEKRTLPGWLPLVLLILVQGVHMVNLDGPFIYDDIPYIVENEDLRSLWPPLWMQATEAEHAPVNGRPLLAFSLAFNYAFGGLHPTGYHLVNIACHLLAALALYGALVQLFGRIEALAPKAGELALASALLWSVHPLNSEVVNYISQRSAALMGACFFATLYAAQRYFSNGERYWVAATAICCALGMAAKETMAPVPIVVLLIDRAVMGGSFAAALRRHGLLYAGLAAGWLVLLRGLWIRPHRDTIGFDYGVGGWTYLLNQAEMIAIYLQRVVWPNPLALDYGFPLSLAVGDIWFQGVFVLGLLALALWAVARRPLWGLVGALFFLALAPTSSFVPIITEVGAERRMYVPLAALLAALVAGGWILLGRGGRSAREGAALIGVLLLMAGWGTYVRGVDYQSALSIWKSAVAARPDNQRTHNNYATELGRAGRFAEAAVHYGRAIALHPGYAEAHNNLGKLRDKMDQPEQALEHYRQAIEIDPGYAEAYCNMALLYERAGQMQEAATYYTQALKGDPDYGPAHNGLGNVLRGQGRLDEALQRYVRAVGLNEDSAEAHNNLGVVLRLQGKTPAALHHLRQAATLDSEYAEAHNNLGNVLRDQGSLAEAAGHYQKALDLQPDLVETYNNLGTIFLAGGKLQQAAVHFMRALELKPDFVEAHSNLGNAFLMAGDQEQAIDSYRQALALNPAYVKARNNLAYALRGAGQLAEAIGQYRQALATAPDLAAARFNLAEALAEAGQREAAVAELQEVLRQVPEHAEAREKLAELQ